MSFLTLTAQTFPNTYLGYLSGATGRGVSNTGFGEGTLQNIGAGGVFNPGAGNVAIGKNALNTNIVGNGNVAIGLEALFSATNSLNTAVGSYALRNLTSGQINVAVGSGAGLNLTTGSGNTLVGDSCGTSMTTGSKNSILGQFSGNQGGLDIRTLNNYVVLSDGDGNPRFWIDNTGAATMPGGLSFLGSLSITGGTVTANNPVLSATQTWNNAGVIFTGWRLNVTDTASAAASLLMDLRVGGVSRFFVGKDSSFSYRAASNQEVAWDGRYLRLARNTSVTPSFTFDAGFGYTINLASPTSINWTASNSDAAPDLSILRDAADTLAQRRGANPQTFRIYRTFTDASNYERANIGWVGSNFDITTEQAGTGAGRNIRIFPVEFISGGNNLGLLLYNAFNSVIPTISIYGGSGANDYLVFNTSSLDFYPSGSGSWSIGRTALPFKNLFLRDYMEMTEMTAPAAPAANQVRIYAEDNGSGKTRLMARFATGAAQQIAIEP
jgi:hypothetical protein